MFKWLSKYSDLLWDPWRDELTNSCLLTHFQFWSSAQSHTCLYLSCRAPKLFALAARQFRRCGYQEINANHRSEEFTFTLESERASQTRSQFGTLRKRLRSCLSPVSNRIYTKSINKRLVRFKSSKKRMTLKFWVHYFCLITLLALQLHDGCLECK